MPIAAPAGFLTRPEASRLFNRSQRALERDLDTALRAGDQDVLTHFKLLTKDGVVREAGDVTTDAVKGLVTEGMTPIWYVEEGWLLETYGRKGEPRPQTNRSGQSRQAIEDVDTAAEEVVPEDTGVRITNGKGIDVSGIYRDQLREKQEEIKRLRRELDIKNEQIRDANERTRESNAIMKDLQKMLGSWQERAFQSLPGSGVAPELSTSMTKPQPGTVPDNESVPPANVIISTVRTKKSAAKSSKSGTKPTRTKKPRKQSGKKQPPPKWYETPTLNRFLKR